MYTHAVLLSIFAALAEARFGQEQIPIAAISAVTSGGASGQAATLAGQAISFLLGAANPCDKLKHADLIVATLGTGADSIAAAKGLVAAEQNFNPFATDIPTICSDPTLPTTEALRGVVPLVDPAVVNSGVENANSAASLNTPFANAGLSVADIMAAQGFTSFSTKDASGAVGAAPATGGAAPVAEAPAATAAPNATAAPVVTDAPAATEAPAVIDAPAASDTAACGGTTFVTVTRGAEATAAPEAPAAEQPAAETPAAGGAAGVDFGLCVPTMDFVAGRPGRKADEFTFLPTDARVAQGQQEALNPNIITNRICDQLTNVCEANQAAKDLCLATKAQILALGTRDQSTADAWNSALGF